MKKFPSVFADFTAFPHGGDYNPDQWMQRYPEVLEEDLRLMNLAECNTFSLGIFAWAQYEPKEGEFHFEWMRERLDRLHEAESVVTLATPSGSKPAWLSHAYPEVCRVNEQGQREHHHFRHNHCFSSPVYRKKVAEMNKRLVQEFGDHPAVKLWHISNEYSGECHCNYCHTAFQTWLKDRYGSLDELNHAWWAHFWSHTITDWSQIDPRDSSVDGMRLDWMRFVTHQTVDFMKAEIAAIREAGSTKPVTTNMMGTFKIIDFWRYADVVDVIADDSYPQWTYSEQDLKTASSVAFIHDLHRSMKKGQPWLLMESCPDSTQWQGTCKLKRPNVYRTEMLQAVAHGADSVMYFQWRKGRGGTEKFHASVVDHEGSENTRIFKQVAQLGKTLQKLTPVLGCTTPSEVAIVMDWDIRWALDFSQGPLHVEGEDLYLDPIFTAHRSFWRKSVSTDVIESLSDFSEYRIIVAPQLYLLKPGVSDRLQTFVKEGGTLILTYLSGVVNESNLCFNGGFPGDGLRKLCGIWAEEIDYLYDGDIQELHVVADNSLGLSGKWACGNTCEVLHAEGAEVVATFGNDFYAGSPALTRNKVGEGDVYYLAAKMNDDFWAGFSELVIKDTGVTPALPTDLPQGVHVRKRSDGDSDFFFIQNFNSQAVDVDIGSGTFTCMESEESVQGILSLAPWQSRMVRAPAQS